MNHFAKLLVVVVAAVVPVVSAAPDSPSILDGAFSKEQVQRGKELYESRCSTCHGEDLSGGEATSLTGVSFRANWQGKTVGQRYELIRGSMPLANPASLNEQEHLDVVTYILNFNGYPTGTTELTPDMEKLNKIVIEPLPKK